jgi:N-acetylmuramoyl-L-alanine amidase CwlA
MAYKLYTELADSSNHGGTRNISNVKYVVLHYTANKNDTAKANANYFKTGGRSASAHYFVDGTSVYQSVYDNVIAWSVGGSKYSDCATTGGGKLYGIVTNSNSISIELCSTNGDFSKKTLENAALLVGDLMNKYNIDIDHVVTHFQITGKHCPAYWMGSKENEAKFVTFKNKVIGKTSSVTPIETISNDSSKEDIAWLQNKLNQCLKGVKGFTQLKIDSDYGTKTTNAVLLYWKQLGWNKDNETDGTRFGLKSINALASGRTK